MTVLTGFCDSAVHPAAHGHRLVPHEALRTVGPHHFRLPTTPGKRASEMQSNKFRSAPSLVARAIALAGTALAGRRFAKGCQRTNGAVMRRSWEPFGGVYARDWALRPKSSRPGPAAYLWVPAFVGVLTVAWKVAGTWTQALLALNVASFIAQCYWPRWETDGVLTVETLESSGTSHRLVTSGFLHASWYHLGANVYTLWFFGRVLEQIFGPGRFIFVYIGSTVAAALLSLWESGRASVTPFHLLGHLEVSWASWQHWRSSGGGMG